MSENITPAYREEKLLANIAGEDYDITPATRKEKLLAEIATGGGGGLPDTSDASVGDVLTVGEDGEAEWSAPSAGSGAISLVRPTSFMEAVKPLFVYDSTTNGWINYFREGSVVEVAVVQELPSVPFVLGFEYSLGGGLLEGSTSLLLCAAQSPPIPLTGHSTMGSQDGFYVVEDGSIVVAIPDAADPSTIIVLITNSDMISEPDM